MIQHNLTPFKYLVVKQTEIVLKWNFFREVMPIFFPFLHDYFHPLQPIENTLQSF